MNGYVTRFSVRQRFEHLAVMTIFTLLVFTGMPQKYFTVGFSRTMVQVFGGIHNTQLVHRTCGWIFTALVVYHLAFETLRAMTRKVKAWAIVPNRQDFFDAIQTLRYYVGLSKEPAMFDRYDYRQKFEYWGMVAGSLIMMITGVILFFPTAFATTLPGQLIPAAKTMHSFEGLMAFLVVIVWHLYNAHLNPDVFPFDFSIFSGKISVERMEHEHPLELARMIEHGEVKTEHAPTPAPPAPPTQPAGTAGP